MFELHPQLAKDCFVICDLELSRILLMNDSQYPWIIQVPRVEKAKEVIDLTPQQQQTLWLESALLSKALQSEFTPHKLNVAALGNMVEQLHIHHIARFTDDPAWPKPVWGVAPTVAYSDQQAEAVIEKIRHQLINKEAS